MSFFISLNETREETAQIYDDTWIWIRIFFEMNEVFGSFQNGASNDFIVWTTELFTD